MANPLALAVIAGMAGGGALGYMSARNDPNQDLSDKAGTTVMSAVVGGVVGGAARYAPWRAIGSMTRAGGRAASNFPMRKAAGLMSKRITSLPKGAKGPLALLALTAAAVGIGAAGARHRVPNEREDYGDSPTFGTLGSSGMKERMGMMGAAGDMVFGLNNARHG